MHIEVLLLVSCMARIASTNYIDGKLSRLHSHGHGACNA